MGERLGRYELLKEIGSGGMAIVHLGRVVGEGGFERLVAVKRLHDQMARDDDFVRMFLDEARLAAQIRHPNVVATIDVQRTDAALFLVMEYVEGLSLSALLRTLRHAGLRLPLVVALRIMLDVLAGLEAAHELTDRDGRHLDLVHRDVSPQNVLVGRDGVARLTDFGVARAEVRLSSTEGGQLKGKLPYMAPEQIANEQIDRRADIYAAGLVLWEMLVGRRAFLADNQGALMNKVLAGLAETPASHSGSVPAAINAVCMKAVSFDALERHARAADFAEELEEASREAEIRVANARTVAAFIAEHMPAADAIPPPSRSGSGVLTPPSLRSASLPSELQSASAHTATAFAAGGRSSRRPILAGGLLILAALGATAAYAAFRGDGKRSEPLPAASAPAEVNEQAPPPSATSSEPSASPPASSSAAAPATLTEPSAQPALAPAGAGAPYASSGGPRPPNPRPAVKAAPKSGDKSAADFLPPEL